MVSIVLITMLPLYSDRWAGTQTQLYRLRYGRAAIGFATPGTIRDRAVPHRISDELML